MVDRNADKKGIEPLVVLSVDTYVAGMVYPKEILEEWVRVHGTLSEAQRKKFLTRNQLVGIGRFPASEVKRAV